MAPAMVSRAAARTGWTAGATRGPAGRDCPYCPAGANTRCLRWIVEKWRDGDERFTGEGRWIRLSGYHPHRESPNSQAPRVVEVMQAEQTVCGNTDQHGYHWMNDERTVWCKGRTR